MEVLRFAPSWWRRCFCCWWWWSVFVMVMVVVLVVVEVVVVLLAVVMLFGWWWCWQCWRCCGGLQTTTNTGQVRNRSPSAFVGRVTRDREGLRLIMAMWGGSRADNQPRSTSHSSVLPSSNANEGQGAANEAILAQRGALRSCANMHTNCQHDDRPQDAESYLSHLIPCRRCSEGNNFAE